MSEKTAYFKLMLVRHGISKSNENHHLVGWTDVALSDNGIEQLKQFKETVVYPEVERFYCSDLQRAKSTFQILFEDKATVYQYRSDLRETNFGSMEDSDPERVNIRDFFRQWIEGHQNGDEENIELFQKRVMQAVHHIIQECQKDQLNSCGIVCHSGVIKMIMMTLRQWPLNQFRAIQVPNGLGFLLTLQVMNDTIQLTEEVPLQPTK